MFKQVLTTFEAAALCRVSYNTIKNWIKRGWLEAHRTAGGHLRIEYAELKKFCRGYGIPFDETQIENQRKVLLLGTSTPSEELAWMELCRVPVLLEIADNAFAAGRMIERHRPDLVIIDDQALGAVAAGLLQQLAAVQSELSFQILHTHGSRQTPEFAVQVDALLLPKRTIKAGRQVGDVKRA